MKRVFAHVVPALVLMSVAVLLLSPAVYAKDVPSGRDGNPGNHYGEISNPGHHYGQLKHQPVPTPVPTPAPSPNPLPTPKPVTHPATGGTHTGTQTGSHGVGAPSPGAVRGDTPSQIDAPVVFPPVTRPSDNIAVANQDRGDDLWWLVLLILPALMAVWLIVAGRLVQRLGRSRRSTSAAMSAAPAATVA